MKTKIKMLLAYRSKTQNELIDVWGLSSRQAVTNKILKERFTVEELRKLCEFLECDIVVRDRKSCEDILKL